MGYTRYDLKKKNKNIFMFIFLTCGILILAFISGSIISNLFIKDINKQGSSNSTKIPKKSVQPILDKKILAIQCGVFSNKENAEKIKTSLLAIGKPFIVEENNKTKVILGIYTEDKANEVIKKLEENKIDFSKVSFKYNLNNPCDIQIIQIVDAELQILEELSKDEVKSVQTKQLKEWCSDLKEVSENNKNYSVLSDLKKYINNLPQEAHKENLEEYNLYLYKKLKELKI